MIQYVNGALQNKNIRIISLFIQRTLRRVRKKKPLNLASRADVFEALPVPKDTVGNGRQTPNYLGGVLVSANQLTGADYHLLLFIHESLHCYCMLAVDYNTFAKLGANTT